jgi:DNA-binding MarR family transcriptional regulator
LAHNLKPPERDGLVQCVVVEKDKRSRRVMLTPARRAKVAESLQVWEDGQRNIEAIFGVQKGKVASKFLGNSHVKGILSRLRRATPRK